MDWKIVASVLGCLFVSVCGLLIQSTIYAYKADKKIAKLETEIMLKDIAQTR